ncbi:MAG TPA: SDR family NAD(P)-dependent oxidoreductase [Chthoniobacterales bacterium]
MKNGGIQQDERTVLVTGGAGFIGTNLTDRLASQGWKVRLLDNLSRTGVEKNLRWLLREHPEHLEFREGDIRDAGAVKEAVAGVELVFHLAAQVAVTTSLAAPIEDFEINARGTLNVLEAIRSQTRPPSLIYTSTNKVYGSLQDLALSETAKRYVKRGRTDRAISEKRCVDFHSPYGCSKGAAEQYVRDYARSYGLKTVVFRMSCIYGPHQFGNEDQGWVAHFLIRALHNHAIVLYGNGKQVRDLLFVDDLIDAFLLAVQKIDTLSGNAFNIGGGERNAVSLLELLDVIEDLDGRRPRFHFGRVREGDQPYFVSDTRSFSTRTGWEPRVSAVQGIKRLHQWLTDNEIELEHSLLSTVAA